MTIYSVIIYLFSNMFIVLSQNVGDIRNEIPFLASIYELTNENGIFLQTFIRHGAIISKTSILVFGNLQTLSSLKMEKLYVKVSVDSNKSETDLNTQYSNVHFIQYPLHSNSAARYNVAIVYLKTKLKLSPSVQIADLAYMTDHYYVDASLFIPSGIFQYIPSEKRLYEIIRIAGFSTKSGNLKVFNIYPKSIAIQKNMSLYVPEDENECIQFSNVAFIYSESNKDKDRKWRFASYGKLINTGPVPQVDFDHEICRNDLYNESFGGIVTNSSFHELFLNPKNCKREFKCANDEGKCYNINKICNKISDCSDGQDEDIIYCNQHYTSLSQEEIENDQIKIDETNQNCAWCLPIILTFVFIIVGIVVLTTFWIRLRRKEAMLNKLTKQELKEFRHGIADIEPKGGNLYENKPFDNRYEISESQLNIKNCEILGEGEFGTVCKGELMVNNAKYDVAIKTIKENIEVCYLKSILSEIKIMQYIGQHVNIVGFFGAKTKNLGKGEVCVIVELCKNGSLKDYLFKNRAFYADKIKSENISEQTLVSNALIKLVHGIAKGMSFLENKKVIHADLAARNVLLSHDYIVKISDFGLSRQLFNYSNYVKKNQAPLPWRWMPIESLSDLSFSSKSDVWAFGVTVWEVFSLVETPYPGLTWETTFVDKLNEGLRLQRPKYLPFTFDNIYEQMLKCWNPIPESRPSFSELELFFEEIEIKKAGSDFNSQNYYNTLA